jgi:preprotein translocase subunit SecA
MAGRGTDIKVSAQVAALTGTVEIQAISDPNVKQAYNLGGLFVIGTEKHETRRIDNQLRGRSGRQGDPGLSQFLVAPTDDIMRIFGGDKLFGVFNSPLFASIPEREPLARSNLLSRNITGVQKQVEGRNFDIRKHILEYDDVLNQHRLVAYARRNRLLDGLNPHTEILAAYTRMGERLAESGLTASENRGDGNLAESVISEVNTFAGKTVISEDDITSLDPEVLA